MQRRTRVIHKGGKSEITEGGGEGKEGGENHPLHQHHINDQNTTTTTTIKTKEQPKTQTNIPRQRRDSGEHGGQTTERQREYRGTTAHKEHTP